MTCKDENIGKLSGGYELGLLEEVEKQRFEDHLLDCEYCFHSLYRTAPLVSLIREKRLAPEAKIELAEEEEEEEEEESLLESPNRGRWMHLFRRPWAYATAGISAVLLIAFVVIFFQGQGGEAERLRGFDDVSILVTSPVGEVTELREIKWKAIAGVESYEVSIYTETGDLMWKETVLGSIAILPDSIREKLLPGQTFSWQVKALTEDGERLKSQLVQFIIRK